MVPTCLWHLQSRTLNHWQVFGVGRGRQVGRVVLAGGIHEDPRGGQTTLWENALTILNDTFLQQQQQDSISTGCKCTRPQ